MKADGLEVIRFAIQGELEQPNVQHAEVMAWAADRLPEMLQAWQVLAQAESVETEMTQDWEPDWHNPDGSSTYLRHWANGPRGLPVELKEKDTGKFLSVHYYRMDKKDVFTDGHEANEHSNEYISLILWDGIDKEASNGIFEIEFKTNPEDKTTTIVEVSQGNCEIIEHKDDLTNFREALEALQAELV